MLRIFAVYYVTQYGCSISVYSRDRSKSHSNVAFELSLKKALKELGFIWDKSNKSFGLSNPCKETIEKIKEMVEFEERVYN